MIDNRCCGRVKVVITRRVAQSHAGAGFPTSMSMPAFQRDGLPTANVGLLPTFYWPDASGTLTAVVDSTPIIRRLEIEHTGRSVLPSDPVVAFLDYLLEEYADEWLTKSVMHFRWHHTQDIEKAQHHFLHGVERGDRIRRCQSGRPGGRAPVDVRRGDGPALPGERIIHWSSITGSGTNASGAGCSSQG